MEPKGASKPKKKSPSEVLREEKIAYLEAKKTHGEKEIETLEEMRNTLARTNAVGLAVSHKTFGRGLVTAQNSFIITVMFEQEQRYFSIPSAFVDGFLSTEDTEMNEKLSQYKEIGEKIKLAKEDLNIAARSIQDLRKK